MNEIMKDFLDLLALEVERNLEKAKKSGALSGEENPLALIKAVTQITVENITLTNESNGIYENLKHLLEAN
ncbi:hypothetical protein P4H32_29345 [Bacillus cereus]|nr:hypothetical protein [Bacillus cereus]